MTVRAQSEWVILYDGPEGLVLKDMNGSVSVTNNAEAVVSVVEDHLGTRRLFYFDSMGQLDEMVVRAGRFDGFKPGSPDKLRAALVREGLLESGS